MHEVNPEIASRGMGQKRGKEYYAAKFARGDQFGIDWNNAIICTDAEDDCMDEEGDYYSLILEDCFRLREDPELDALGIKMCAEVKVDAEDGDVTNRIVFRRHGAESATVDCVHTAIATLPAGDVEEKFGSGRVPVEFAREMESSEEVRLPAEEHFKSLRSYVAGIAEAGIGNMIGAGYEGGGYGGESPFGFNSEMVSQIVSAIISIDDRAGLKIVGKVVEGLRDAPAEWRHSRVEALDERISLREWCARSEEGSATCLELFPRHEMILEAVAANDAAEPDTLQGVLDRAMELPPSTRLAELPRIIRKLSGNENLGQDTASEILSHFRKMDYVAGDEQSGPFFPLCGRSDIAQIAAKAKVPKALLTRLCGR